MANDKSCGLGGAGSHSAFAQGNGVLVNLNGGATDAEDIIRYEPFGDFRGNARPDDITDHSLQTTFTGHEDNMDIGLVYMKARY